jgi:hypothetical protein
MYTIRPRSAGVIGFAGPPHDDKLIASVAAIPDLKKGPKLMCTIG